MSASASIVKASVGTAVLTTTAGLLLYETLFNVKLARKIGDTFFGGETAPEACTDTKESSDRERSRLAYEENRAAWCKTHKSEDVFIRTASGETRHALIFRSDGPSDKWAVLLHGYTSCPENMIEFACVYNQLGFNCILPSMIGHGRDGHSHTSMGWKDRLAVLDIISYVLLLSPEAKIVVHGVSMGAATTLLVTGETLPENVKAAVADCAYTSVYDQYKAVGKQRKISYLIPLVNITSGLSRLLGNLSFRNCSPLKAAARSSTPTLFIHGENDELVPYAMSAQLFDGCSAEKRKISVKGAGHAQSSWVDPEYYWGAVREFLEGRVC